MGGLSRKRLQPRIVKKVKRKQANSVSKLPEAYRTKWDQKRSIRENFGELGLRLNLKPNLRHSKEGKDIVKGKQKLDQLRREQQFQKQDSDDEEEGENEISEEEQEVYEQKEAERDYLELFPNILSEKDITRGPSIAKLRGDDVHIVQKLIKKYGENVDRMFKDIKTNVMQWSKSELQTKLKAYKIHHEK